MLTPRPPLSDLSASLNAIIDHTQRPWYGPSVGTVLTMLRDGTIDVRADPLHLRIHDLLPLELREAIRDISQLDDGRATSILIFRFLLNELASGSLSSGAKSSAANELSLLAALGPGGLLERQVDHILETMAVAVGGTVCCINEMLRSHLSPEMAQCFTSLAEEVCCALDKNSDGHVAHADRITFSAASGMSVSRESKVECSVGLMLEDCYRDVHVGSCATACILEVHGSWCGVVSAQSDSDSEGDIIEEFVSDPQVSNVYFERFQTHMAALALRGVRVVVSRLRFPRWMLQNQGGSSGVHLVHACDKDDLLKLKRRLRVEAAVATESGIKVDSLTSISFSRCFTCGHGRTSDKQYLVLEGISSISAPEPYFAHVKVPSVRLVPAYFKLLLGAMRLRDRVQKSGVVPGGGSGLNSLGAALEKPGSTWAESALGHACRMAAVELVGGRECRRTMLNNPSMGVVVGVAGVTFCDGEALLRKELHVCTETLRGSVVAALTAVRFLLGIDGVVGICGRRIAA